MSPTPTPPFDPFALLMNPQAVVQAMERSDRLGRLQRHICRPLDRPVIPRTGKELAEFDSAVDLSEVELRPEAPALGEDQSEG